MKKLKPGTKAWCLAPTPDDVETCYETRLYEVVVMGEPGWGGYALKFVKETDGEHYFSKVCPTDGARWDTAFYAPEVCVGTDGVGMVTDLATAYQFMAGLYQMAAGHFAALVSKLKAEEKARKKGKVVIEKEGR